MTIKKEILMGVIVTALGLMSLVSCFLDHNMILGVFGAVLVVVGYSFFNTAYTTDKTNKEVEALGEIRDAVIHDFKNDSMVKFNSAYLKLMVIRYYDAKGRIREAYIPTGKKVIEGYPVGYFVKIKEYEGNALLINDVPPREPTEEEERTVRILMNAK